MNEETRKLLERTVNLLDTDDDFPVGTTEKLVADIKDTLEQDDYRELFSTFKYYIHDNIYAWKEITESRDKIKLIRDFGWCTSMLPTIDKYWNNMDVLFQRLGYLISLCEKVDGYYYCDYDGLVEKAFKKINVKKEEDTEETEEVEEEKENEDNE